MANPLPATRSFFPDTQARSRLCRQSLQIDRFLRRNHIRNYNVLAIRGRFKITERHLADVQVFDQRYFAGPVARSIRMNRLKAVGDFIFHCFPILRLDLLPHLFFHFFAVVGRLVHSRSILARRCCCQTSNLLIAKRGRNTRLDRVD